MSPTWYDVLGVEPEATDAEITAAWRALVSELGPTDRRFASLNEAAAVLLDPDKRALYDATLEPVEPTLPTEAADSAEPAPNDEPLAPASLVVRPDRQTGGLGRLLAYLGRPATVVVTGVVTLALVVVAISVYALRDRGPAVMQRQVAVNLTDAAAKPFQQTVATREEADAAAALAAAMVAVGPLVSFDYRTLAQDEAAAKAVSTADYAAKQFVPFFDGVVKRNAPRLKQVVTADAVLDAGVVHFEPGKVQVLVLVDRRSKNATVSYISQDFAVLTMVDQNGHWLVADLMTAPISK